MAQRFDFKGSEVLIDFKRAENVIKLEAEGEMRAEALLDVLRGKLLKRGVPVKNLDITELKPGGGEIMRRDIKLKMALDSDTAKKVSAAVKDAKLKKVTASIQGEQVRVEPRQGRAAGCHRPAAKGRIRRGTAVREFPLSGC